MGAVAVAVAAAARRSSCPCTSFMTSTTYRRKGSDIGSSGSIDGSMRSAGGAVRRARGRWRVAAGAPVHRRLRTGAAGAVAARSTYTALNTSVVIQRLNGVLAQ
jgi:hypothetical protein